MRRGLKEACSKRASRWTKTGYKAPAPDEWATYREVRIHQGAKRRFGDGCLSSLRLMAYWPLRLVRAFGPRSRLGLSIAPPFGIRSASLTLPTSWPNMPSADLCHAVRPPFDGLSHRSDAEQISWGKLNCLPCTVAGCTLRTLDGYGLRGKSPARPALAPYIRFLSIDSHICSMLLSDPASRR